MGKPQDGVTVPFTVALRVFHHTKTTTTNGTLVAQCRKALDCKAFFFYSSIVCATGRRKNSRSKGSCFVFIGLFFLVLFPSCCGKPVVAVSFLSR
jgi:hypothetical protein